MQDFKRQVTLQLPKAFSRKNHSSEEVPSDTVPGRLAVSEKDGEGIRQTADGHYEMPLPFQGNTPKLPDNKSLALRRLNKLKTRMENDMKYREDYMAFMQDIIAKGFAERVLHEQRPDDDGRLWYIPHHGVYHPQKPDKIRIVFDCSATFMGHSLNKYLLQGPDLTNSLVGVLCRF